MLKFVIGDDAPDDSQIPTGMRALPPLPKRLEDPDEQPADLRGRARQSAAARPSG